jgi:hypothetical protein
MGIVKLGILLILIGIIGSLGSALFYLSRDSDDSKRTVRALTVRVGLSVLLFILLLLAYAAGLVQPNASV